MIFLKHSQCQYQEGLFFREITGSPCFAPNTPKANLFHNPTLWTVHIWLIGSLHRKKESTRAVTSIGVFFILCICHRLQCSTGIQFICHCQSIRVYLLLDYTGYLSVGSFVTRIATHFCFGPSSIACSVPTKPIDRPTTFSTTARRATTVATVAPTSQVALATVSGTPL